jgi:hypothetical protein
LGNVVFSIGKTSFVEGELIKDTIGRIRGTAFHQRREMHHVVVALTDAIEVLIPIPRIAPHEFGEDGKYGERIERQVATIEGQSRGNINVMGRRSRSLGHCDRRDRKLRKWRISDVECERTRFGDGNIDLDVLVEIRLKSGVV